MTVVVSGASGFIGRRVDHLADDEVVAIEHRWEGARHLRRLLPSRVDACIHLAWTASTDDYLTSPSSNQASFDASLELVEVLSERGCGHLVVAGSCAEYDESEGILGEDAPLRADSPYAEFKMRLHRYLDEFAIPFAWTRLFGIVGPGEAKNRLMPSVVRSLTAGRPMALSPGDQVRDLIDVDDTAWALLALSRGRQVGVFNICRGEAVVLKSFLLLLAEVAQADPTLLQFGIRPYGPIDPMHVVGDPSRLLAAAPLWSPAFSTADIAARIVGDVDRDQGA